MTEPANRIHQFGKLIVNSRVNIDYRGEKPTVNFEYPDTKTRPGSVESLIGILFAFIILVCFAYNQLTIPTQITSISVNGTEVIAFYQDNLNQSSVVIFTIEDRTWPHNMDPKLVNQSPSPLKELILITFWMSITLAVMLLGRYLTHLFFAKTRKGSQMYPKLNSMLAHPQFRATVLPTQVIKTKEGWQWELPLFSNVKMDYRLTEDFSRYIQTVKIIEHPFDYIISTKRDKWIKDADGKPTRILKTRTNIYLWKAVFTFSAKPKTGQLEVTWK